MSPSRATNARVQNTDEGQQQRERRSEFEWVWVPVVQVLRLVGEFVWAVEKIPGGLGRGVAGLFGGDIEPLGRCVVGLGVAASTTHTE